MTSNKSFKGRVRARMDKTGERYATARRQLVAKAAAKGEPEATAGRVPGGEGQVPATEAQVPGAEGRGHRGLR